MDCMRVLKLLNVKRIVHTTDGGYNIIDSPASHAITTHASAGRRYINTRI